MGGRESRQSTDPDCLDQVFVALGNRHRRRILADLLEGSPRDVEQLLPSDGDVDGERLAVEYHHSHLPKLDDDGFVQWDGDSRVRRGPKFEEVARVIRLFDEHGNQLPGEWP